MISRTIFVSAILMATMSTPAFATTLKAKVMETFNNDIMDNDFDFAQIDTGSEGLQGKQSAGGQQQPAGGKPKPLQ